MKGMEKLKLVIGPAPSELPYEELLKKLSAERERMSAVMHLAPKGAKAKRRTPSTRKQTKKRSSKKLNAAEIAKMQKFLEGF